MPKFSVAESAQINDSPQNVFDVVADFGTWTTWSPWLCAEPDAQVDVSENSNSLGSLYQWKGEVVGQGEIEHVALDPGKRIDEALRFIKPWNSKADVSFDFEPSGGGTKVTWKMNSSLPWFMFWMKKMMVNVIGMDYERGLSMLKQHIETGKVLSETQVQGVQTIRPITMLGVRSKASLKEIGASMENAISDTVAKLRQNGVAADGLKMAAYHDMDMSARVLDYTAGVIVEDESATAEGLSRCHFPSSKALSVRHIGCYTNLGNAWSTGIQHTRYRKLKQNRKVATYEIYRNNPGDTDPADLITDLYFPLK